MALFFIGFFGAALIAAPIVASAFSHPIAGVSTIIMTLIGLLLVIGAGALAIVTQLYVKTKADEALVRTGMGGNKVVVDGGVLVIGVIHQLVRISLRTLRLEVVRENGDALITSDNLRADVRSEFFVRVQAQPDDINKAARSIGDMTGDALQAAKTVVEDKLVSALRTVAAKKTLEQLNNDRASFVEEVQMIVTQDLAHNGLTLEVCTISKLDQTDTRNLRDNNIFDAQGKATIAKIVQTKLTEQNEFERQGEQERAAQNVATRKKVLALQQDQAGAEANQKAEIAKITAAKEQEGQTAQLESEKAVEVARRQKDQAVEVAQRDADKAVSLAEQAKLRATEVAERERQAAVAEAESLRVKKEEEKAKAEAEREKATQSITTVQVTAGAERDKVRKVIEAQAEAETTFVAKQRAADGDAYGVERQAEAQKKSAEASALAVTTAATADAKSTELKAEASAKAKEAEARGQTAIGMVPVNVAQKQVEVDQQRVTNVLIPELQAREQHGQAAQEFALAQLRIEAEKTVRIETAKASATIGTNIKATLFGTPEQLGSLMADFNKGMGIAQMVEGFMKGTSPETMTMVDNAASAAGQVVEAVADRIAGSGSKGDKKS